jgi:hypothetical protein
MTGMEEIFPHAVFFIESVKNSICTSHKGSYPRGDTEIAEKFKTLCYMMPAKGG